MKIAYGQNSLPFVVNYDQSSKNSDHSRLPIIFYYILDVVLLWVNIHIHMYIWNKYFIDNIQTHIQIYWTFVGF